MYGHLQQAVEVRCELKPEKGQPLNSLFLISDSPVQFLKLRFNILVVGFSVFAGEFLHSLF
jgi:hypothetical protein